MMTEERFHEDESRGHTRMDYAEARKKSHEMQQRIERLLELQTNPEQLTDEQMQQILADDEMRQLVEQLGFAKRAFKHDELVDDTPDVEAEWEKFSASHANELTNAARAEGKLACTMPCKEEEDDSQLDALDEEKAKPRFHAYLFTHKVAASFIGVLLVSGIAFAAIWSLTPSPSPKERGVDTTFVGDSKEESNHSPLLGRGAGGEASHIFNNVPLDSMLTAIAAAHRVQVEFENEAARQLRFDFVWKREDSLTRVVEKLNTFEAVNIVEEDKTLVVR